MTVRDRVILAALSLILVVAAVQVALPPHSAALPTVSPVPVATGNPASPPATYREGIVGHPGSITPLTARNDADRDLGALIFSGLVALGPEGGYRPDIASAWSVDATGNTWTFTIRPDARWQDGAAVTATDVAFTIGIIQNPDYTGPLAASWRDVTVTVVDERTVRFALSNPIGGFLSAATIGLLPAHLLSSEPVATLANGPFSQSPVGSGPFRLASWNASSADLVRVADASVVESAVPSAEPSVTPSGASPSASGSGAPAASAPPSVTQQPGQPLAGIQFSFFNDAATLAQAYRDGKLDAASGLPPIIARELAATPGNHLLGYPRTTLTAIALNVRVGNGDLRVPQVRKALLAAINRPAIIAGIFDGAATLADTPIPPSSWAFDAKASSTVKYDPKAAVAGLKAAGWKKITGGWSVGGVKQAYSIELITPDATANPTAMAVATAVADDWRAIGLKVTVTGLRPAEFVDQRLSQGSFKSAVVDVTIGFDPDLYPLFASTQVLSGGTNITGIQDLALNKLLEAARAPGTLAQRKNAFSALEQRLATSLYMLPILFRQERVVVSDRVFGPTVREIDLSSDRFWDVLTWRLAEAR